MPATMFPCGRCGHRHEYEFSRICNCKVHLHSGGDCQCGFRDFIDITTLPTREEGEIIPIGMSLTETSKSWSVYCRPSENEWSCMRIPKDFGEPSTFHSAKREVLDAF